VIMSGDELEEEVAVVSRSCEFLGNGACRWAQESGDESACANRCADSADAPMPRLCRGRIG
jgi:hypothetical protein